MPNRKNSTTITISLPPEMAGELDAVCQAENRTRSELVREALRQYVGYIKYVQERLANVPSEEPEPGDLEAIEEGRRAIERGEYITLEQLRDEMGLDHHQSGAQRPTKVAP